MNRYQHFLLSLRPRLPCWYEGLLAVRLVAPSPSRRAAASPCFSPHTEPLRNLRPFHRALAAGKASVTETREGRVSTLLFYNRSSSVLFAMAGELFVGGRQDRVLNRSLVLKPGEMVTAPVSCVEASRWSAGRHGETFAAAGITACTSVRASVHETRIQHLKNTGTEGSHQTRIWKDISKTLYLTGTAHQNETKTLAGAMYRRKKKLNAYAKQFRPTRRQLGWVLFCPSSTGPRLIGADAFGSQTLLLQYSPRIFRGAAMEVTASAPPKSSQAQEALARASALLRSLCSLDPLEPPHPRESLGPSPAADSTQEHHFHSSWGVATLLSYGSRPVHLSLSS